MLAGWGGGLVACSLAADSLDQQWGRGRSPPFLNHHLIRFLPLLVVGPTGTPTRGFAPQLV